MIFNLKERFTVQAAASGTPAGSDDVFANLNEQGDTANIWHERPFRVLKPYMTEDRLHFSMEADSAFRRGDDILWRFDARYVGRGRQSEAYAGFFAYALPRLGRARLLLRRIQTPQRAREAVSGR